MNDTRQEVRIKIATRAITLEAVAEVVGDHSPDEAVRMVRDVLVTVHHPESSVHVEYVNQAVEG